MSFNCNICSKEYKSYQSLWNHNKKEHKSKMSDECLNLEKTSDNCLKMSEKLSDKKYNCTKCNKQFNNRKTKWSHEKKCNEMNDNTFCNLTIFISPIHLHYF